MSKRSSRKVPKILNDGTRFVYKGRTQLPSPKSPKPDYLAVFAACHGNKEAMAKFLFKNRTPGEHALADALRQAKIHFRQQAVLYGWIADILLLDHNAVVEIDGSYHQAPQKLAEDRRRDAILRSRGLRVFRYETITCQKHAAWVVADLLDRLSRPAPSFNLSATHTTDPERKQDTRTMPGSDTPRIETPDGESLTRGTGPVCKEGPEAISGIHQSGRA